MANKKPKIDQSGRKMIDARHARIDTQIAAGLVVTILLSKEGVAALQQMLQAAKDPVQVIAHVLYGAIAKVKQQLHARKMKIDERVWIAHGGVLDRVMVEIMMFIGTGLKFQPATNPQFVAQVKQTVLQLMEQDDKNTKAIKLLNDNGLPIPGQPQQQQGAGGQQQPPQGLVAPQGGPQQQPMAGGQ